ncbi:MAG: hypothetical protein ACO3NL_14555, partial [Phycisphaerales bacterium]
MTNPLSPQRLASAPALLAISFLASFGTGMVWNGLAFITRESYGFGELENLLLAVFNGAVYVGAAFAAGPLTRAIERRLSPRGLTIGLLALQAACCPLPLLFESAWPIWPVAGLLSAASAVQWPLIESYLTAGRHGAAMRRTIGWWNVTWMVAVTLAMVAMGPMLSAGHAEWNLAGLAVLFAIAAAISPLMPYLLDGLETPLSLQTPITSLWLVARVALVIVLWRTHFWHGRWSTLLAAGVLMVGGFGAMVLAESLWTMGGGLVAFGLGQGIVYYAALYYAMAVGRAGVDAGGTHEALIGLGYGVGPAVAAFGSLAAGGPGIVGAIWIVVAISVV